MARTTATVSFQAIELKGSLLPGSLLEQVARLQAPLQKEADYGLPKGERLRERIDAAWVRLKEIWEEYKDLRERAAQGVSGLHTTVRILREVLGWPDLQPCSGWQHGDAHFPITHRAFEGAVPQLLDQLGLLGMEHQALGLDQALIHQPWAERHRQLASVHALQPGGHVLAADRLLLHLEAMPSQRLMQQRGDFAAGHQDLAGCGIF